MQKARIKWLTEVTNLSIFQFYKLKLLLQYRGVGFNSITIPANYRANIGQRNSSIKMPLGKQYIMNSKTRTESSSPIAVHSRHSCRGEWNAWNRLLHDATCLASLLAAAVVCGQLKRKIINESMGGSASRFKSEPNTSLGLAFAFFLNSISTVVRRLSLFTCRPTKTGTPRLTLTLLSFLGKWMLPLPPLPAFSPP